MADAEREDSYYYPGGVPITPQARRFGYEFPVFVSKGVWRDCCIATDIATRLGTSLELRIWHLLQCCYEGMAKKLATEEDFLYYEFKSWFWERHRPNATKQRKASLGARLMINPSTDGPWLYIFSPSVDTIDALEKGQPPCDDPTEDDLEAADCSPFPDLDPTGQLAAQDNFYAETSSGDLGDTQTGHEEDQ